MVYTKSSASSKGMKEGGGKEKGEKKVLRQRAGEVLSATSSKGGKSK